MRLRLAALAWFTLLTVAVQAQTAGDTPVQGVAAPAGTAAQPAKRPFLKYAAPKAVGNSGTRVDGDGGSRSAAGKDVAIYLLAPDGEALTTQKQPSLFYFQRGGAAALKSTLTFTVLDPAQPVPLLKARAESPEPGFRRVQLARHDVELRAGVRYELRVSLGNEAEGRSSDVFASGVIRCVEPSPELVRALEAAPGKRAEIYAQHGIWYDALEEVSNRILAEPQNQEWLRARASLLEQIGLGRILEKGH